jgi:hypothetical protein
VARAFDAIKTVFCGIFRFPLVSYVLIGMNCLWIVRPRAVKLRRVNEFEDVVVVARELCEKYMMKEVGTYLGTHPAEHK